MSEIIRTACIRARSDYRTASSADLATAVVQPAALQPTDLMTLFQALPSTAIAEAGKLFGYGEYIRRTEAALAAGNLAETMAFLAIGSAIIAMSADTHDALMAVLTPRIMRLIDVVAYGQGETAPATVSAADVDAALGR